MRVALVCVLVGCGYQPGSFAHASHDFVGQRVTVGCLDIAVERRADHAIGPVLGYQFANRCDRAAPVDLAAVAVIGRDAQGADVALRPYDPRGEIHPAALDGRSAGAEAVVYGVPGRIPGHATRAAPIREVCADAAALGDAAPPHWLCFGAPRATGGAR
ncbi:MAG TPA: hypothetical protein VHW23_08935 [Kofleriaceae bacterium]|jgi:hypothetical protein|nr:hypothetical protein [Kofleriaceae bacterium]